VFYLARTYSNIKKSMLFSREVVFLGHNMSEPSIELDPKKIERIVNWPTPTNSTDVRCLAVKRLLPLGFPVQTNTDGLS
jgi:hypothetical protein